MAFYKSKLGQRILLLFGGQINGADMDDLGEVSNELIAVDVDNLKWWVVDVAGGPVTARLESRLVIVGDQFFIFGGKTYVDGQFQPTESYSVATLRNHQWTWDAHDVPYPAHVPVLGSACDAVVIREGDTTKILLSVGWHNIDPNTSASMPELLPRNMVLFDIGLRTFTPQIGDGEGFPGTVTRYNIYELPGALQPDASAVICTFFHGPHAKPPELYVYSLPPQAGCRALGLRKHIAATKTNIRAVCCGGVENLSAGMEERQVGHFH
ncbi:hypothetical protein DFH07DRAFT_956077 [Mycena maculata]|uniref:Uncharacterized protein n=1 Tax=Mycena maculata TaxID=230809 RepID=A0AAD7JGZ7_9AGAR|nr:hypothetical protein DFH07DRAFT_956077 [Mycena maculata]